MTDSLHANGQGEFDFRHLLEHLNDHVVVPLPPLQVGGLSLDLSITKHMLFLLVGGMIVFLMAYGAARQNRKQRVPRGLGNLMEIIVVFIRDEIAMANMGPAGLRYLPYLLTTFFFILILNLLGLVPFGATATGNLAVTAGLALIAFVMIQVSAIRAHGVKHYLAHLTGGVAWWLWPIMIPIEILGLFTKPFALCMRLFANMTGGHIVLLSLMGFIFLARSFLFAPVPVLFSVAIYLLELLVALIQAYIFTMLTSLFMGLGMAGSHEGQERHGH
jgi:F-type H+-transporting ATPase subunit a